MEQNEPRDYIDRLEIYVVYLNPSDYPGKYVVKRDIIEKGNVGYYRDPDYVLTSTQYADVVKELTPRGLVRMERNPEDPRAILETWI